VLRVIAWRQGFALRRSTVALMLSNAASSVCCSSRPGSVSSSFRGLRKNSATPSDSSSERIWWLIAVAVTDSSSAACLALSWRAAASKARNAESEGNRRCAMAEFLSSVVGRNGRLSLVQPSPRLDLPRTTDEFNHRGESS